MNIALEAKKIFFGDFVLDIPKMEIPAGSLIVVTGPSGAGKSTFMRYLAGLLETSWEYASSVTMMFQDYGLLPYLLVGENIRLGCIKSSDFSHAKKVMEELGIPQLDRRKIHEISGGEAARVALARTLLVQRPIVCLDEPFRALDGRLAFEIGRLALEKLRQRNRTVVMISHDPWDVVRYADFWISVKAGSVSMPLSVEKANLQTLLPALGLSHPELPLDRSLDFQRSFNDYTLFFQLAGNHVEHSWEKKPSFEK